MLSSATHKTQYNTMCVVQVDYCHLAMRGMIRIIIANASIESVIFSSIVTNREKIIFWTKFVVGRCQYC